MVIVAGLALWVAVPVVCIAAVRDRSDDTRLAGIAPTTVEVQATTEELVTSAGLRLRWAAHSPVVAPGWTGTVTDLRLTAGDRADDGAIVGSVDGVDRMLVASDRPFSRPLALGDTGGDVRALNELLRRRGLEASAADRFGDATARGVTALGRALGAGPTTAFDPAWVLYLSHDAARVTGVHGTVGGPAPSAGEIVLDLAPDLVGADVIAHQDAAPAAPAGGATSTDPSEATTPEAPPALTEADPQEVPRTSVLRVDAVELALAENRAAVAGDALSRLRSLVATLAPYADATIAEPPAEGNVVVPAGAVVSDQQGRTCVLVRRADGVRPEAATVLGGDEGRTILVPSDPARLHPGVRVQVGTPAGSRSCR